MKLTDGKGCYLYMKMGDRPTRYPVTWNGDCWQSEVGVWAFGPTPDELTKDENGDCIFPGIMGRMQEHDELE